MASAPGLGTLGASCQQADSAKISVLSPGSKGLEQQGASRREDLECVAEVAGWRKCISSHLKIVLFHLKILFWW